MSGNPFGYSEAVWRLFAAAPRSGTLAGPDVRSGQAGTAANRNQLLLQVKMAQSRVADARFQAYGCPTTVAVGAWLADWAIGKGLAELAGIHVKMIREALEIPEDRTHCALLGEDAVKALLSPTR